MQISVPSTLAWPLTLAMFNVSILNQRYKIKWRASGELVKKVTAFYMREAEIIPEYYCYEEGQTRDNIT